MNTQACRPHPPWNDRGRGFICHGMVEQDLADIERLVLEMGMANETQRITYSDRSAVELPLVRTSQLPTLERPSWQTHYTPRTSSCCSAPA